MSVMKVPEEKTAAADAAARINKNKETNYEKSILN
jgi:hypothetical protein